MTKELQENLYRQGADNKVLFCEVMAGLLNRQEKEVKAMLTGAH